MLEIVQSRISEQTSDWLNSFVLGGEETQKSVDQLGFPVERLIKTIFFHFVHWLVRRI